jgi:1,4-dihydroxy-6-naphthoate synthase
MPEIVFGHSPDADDAFMFYALAKEHVTIPGYDVGHHMVDIESLNKLADIGDIPVTAISAAHYPAVADKYRIMSCGASVGRNYGPVIVSNSPMKEADLLGKTIGVPGEFTTSWLLYRIFAPPFAEAKFYNFDEVGPAVKSGEVDAGILLHEGQILYEQEGFHGVLDLGKRWFEKTGLPIPLGLDLVNRKLGEELSQQYVNEDTVDLGEDGTEALETLFGMAAQRGIIDEIPELDLVQAK